jgi:hypothetical protein
MFSWTKIEFLNCFLHCRVRTEKLLNTKVKKIKKKFGKYFWGVKIFFFMASYFGFRVKGVCPLLLPLVSLVKTQLGLNFFQNRYLGSQLGFV